MDQKFNHAYHENIQLDIMVRKIELEKREIRTFTENSVNQTGKSINIKVDKQILKPESICFEKLPIQKLIPVAFLDCIKSFSRIERINKLIYIDFQMQKEWIVFLDQKIQNYNPDLVGNKSKIISGIEKIDVDVVQVDGTRMYGIYSNNYPFRFTFSENNTRANIVCGLNYLMDNHNENDECITQDEIKRGLLNYIIKKWTK